MLKATVDNLDDIDEKYHDLYEERDGKFYLKRIEGLVTAADVTRVQTALNKEKDAHKQVKALVNQLKDYGDIEEVIETLQRVPELEAAASANGGKDPAKIDELVNARLKTKLAPVERERDQYKAQVGELTGQIEEFQSERRTRTIGDAVRTTATKLKVRPEAVEDVLLLAERTFELDEEGQVVAKDKAGVTPGINVEAWLGDLQTKKPHWWGDSVGGGATGSGRGGQVGVNPWKRDSWNVTKQGEIIRADRKRAEQLAKAAGTSLGGSKPLK